MSRPAEIQHTTFLAERLSKAIGKRFRAEPEKEQNSDTDTWIVVEAGERTPVQNVTSEGEVLKQAKFNTKAIQRGEPLQIEEVKHLEWISSAIAGKEKKLYANAEQLVIVVHASMPYMPAQYIKDTLGNIDSSFAGIYYVCVSTTNPASSYVVALQKHWDTKEIF